MKRKGILNRELMRAIADMGHEQLIVIGDAGVPVNDQAKRIDLSIAEELSTVRQVLELIRDGMIYERVTAAAVAE